MISVSPVPDGPFGQDRRYGPACGRVNGVVHELPLGTPRSIHEFCTGVDIPWTTGSVPSGGGERRYPPIANISSRGRLEDVAAVRSSE